MASKKTVGKKTGVKSRKHLRPKAAKSSPGRPSEYETHFPQLLIDYFKVEYETYTEEVASQGQAVEIKKKRLKKFPTIEGFCSSLYISKETFHKWLKIHQNLMDAYSVAKQKQKDALIAGGMGGQFNAGFAKFVAINCTDMVDKTEVKTEGDVTVKPYGLAFDLKKKPEEID